MDIGFKGEVKWRQKNDMAGIGLLKNTALGVSGKRRLRVHVWLDVGRRQKKHQPWIHTGSTIGTSGQCMVLIMPCGPPG
jgi:hypothetical protein